MVKKRCDYRERKTSTTKLNNNRLNKHGSSIGWRQMTTIPSALQHGQPSFESMVGPAPWFAVELYKPQSCRHILQ